MKPKKDPFSTSVHMDLMHGQNETRRTVFTALSFMEDCPHTKVNRAEVLESYGITEADVEKYYQDWLDVIRK
jgi:hypothetical protein